MNDECGPIGGRFDRGNKRTRRKLAPVLLCPLQIPYELTQATTRPVAVGSQRAMTRPYSLAVYHEWERGENSKLKINIGFNVRQ
jgi:hypothetical protein